MTASTTAVLLLASRQGGWVAGHQVAELGVSRATFGRIVHAGILERSGGLYRVNGGGRRRTADSRLWYASLLTKGVISHRSAAHRFGAKLTARHVDVTIDYRRKITCPDDVRLHRSRHLPNRHVMQEESGLRFTSSARTFVDLCAPRQGLSDAQLLTTLDQMMAAGSLRPDWLFWFVDTEARALHGRSRSLRLLQDGSSEGAAWTVSVAAAELARLLRKHNQAPFERERIVADGDRVIAHLDFAWPSERLGVEMDGYRFHVGPDVFAKDRWRQNAVQKLGWELCRFTPADVRDRPEYVLATIADARQRRNGAGSTGETESRT